MRKTIEDKPALTASQLIAIILHQETCIIRGCEPRWHMAEAKKIIQELKSHKYINGDVE